jgi:hypothetical protein
LNFDRPLSSFSSRGFDDELDEPTEGLTTNGQNNQIETVEPANHAKEVVQSTEDHYQYDQQDQEDRSPELVDVDEAAAAESRQPKWARRKPLMPVNLK